MIRSAAVLVGALFLLAACSAGSPVFLSDAGGGDAASKDGGTCAPNPGRCMCGQKTCVGGTWICPVCQDASPPPPPIRASDYNQKCSVGSDCIAIEEGDVCGCGGCGNAAINVSDQGRFNADETSRRAQCAPSAQPCPDGCQLTQAYCSGGTCAVCHQPGCALDAGPGDAGTDIGLGGACNAQNDQCTQGLLCCAQGGGTDAGSPGPTVCTAAQGNPPACPMFH